MNLKKHALAVGGAFLLTGSSLVSGQAFAFGSEWRPATGYAAGGPGTPAAYQRIANVPRFRPYSASGPNRYRDRVAALRSEPRPNWAMAAPRYATAPAYPAYGPPPQPYVMPMPMPMPSGAPGWAQPFSGMAQVWQEQVPMFARQFAWRPADSQPWSGNAMPPMQPAWQPYAASPPTGYPLRPDFASNAPAGYAGWRTPTAGPAAPYGYRAPGYTAGRQASFRPGDRTGWSTAVPHYAQAAPSIGLPAPGQWRPEPVATQVGWRSTSFRPVGYGQSSAARNARLAGSSDASQGLPGWLTTYQETDVSAGCAWCEGS